MKLLNFINNFFSRRKKGEDNEVMEDPKMKTMRRNLQTEDGSKFLFVYHNCLSIFIETNLLYSHRELGDLRWLSGLKSSVWLSYIKIHVSKNVVCLSAKRSFFLFLNKTISSVLVVGFGWFLHLFHLVFNVY